MLTLLGFIEDGVVTGGYAAELWDLASGEIDVIGGAGARSDIVGLASPTEPSAWVPTRFVAAGDVELYFGSLERRTQAVRVQCGT